MKMICPRCKNTHSQRAPGKKNDNRCIPCVQKDQAAYYQANKEKFRGYRERARAEEKKRRIEAVKQFGIEIGGPDDQ